MARIGLIGTGNVGWEFYLQAGKKHEVAFVAGSDGSLYEHLIKVGSPLHVKRIDPLEGNVKEALPDDIDALCLAIPSDADGNAARDYIKKAFAAGVPVVTCEKSALAHHMQELKPHLDKIGYRATVGGGSGILPYGKEMLSPNGTVNPDISRVTLVCNGTLTYLLSELAQKEDPSGNDLSEIISLAKQLGYAEPGAVSDLAVVNGEAYGDVPLKVAIAMEIWDLAHLTEENVEALGKPIAQGELDRVVGEAKSRRFAVRLRKDDGLFLRPLRESTVIGHRYTLVEGWQVHTGFWQVDPTLPRSTVLSRSQRYDYPTIVQLTGVENAVWIAQPQINPVLDELNPPDAIEFQKGLGAGPEPTADAMMQDLEDLLAA